MTSQLDFDFDSRRNQSIAYVGGDDESAPYRVRMIQDESPENPFEAWEGYWPMIADYQHRGHNFRTYDNAPGACLDDPFQRFSDGQLIALQSKICAVLSSDGEARYYNALTGQWGTSLADDLADHKRDYRGDYVEGREGAAAMLRDYFTDALGDVSDSDKLEALAGLYSLLGIPCLCTSSHGYSQGDYAELLIVATPEAMESFGWSKAKQQDKETLAKDLQGQADLYSAWAWGDVYGAIVERAPIDPDDRDDDDAWEEVDSCWGFYGDNAEKSGLADFALSAIAHDRKERKIAHFDKLKELIRANAPLAARQSVLSGLAF